MAANEEGTRPVAARGNTEALAAGGQPKNSSILNLGEEVVDLDPPADEEEAAKKRKRDEDLKKCIEANLKFRRLQLM